MKKIFSLLLAILTVAALVCSCGDGNSETTTSNGTTTSTQTSSSTTTTQSSSDTSSTQSDSSTTSSVSEGNTSSSSKETTSSSENETTTTLPETDATSTINTDWNKEPVYENGMLKTYIGAFKATNLDIRPSEQYEITSNDLAKYDATIIMYFTVSCTSCKRLLQYELQPYFEKYGDKVLVLSVLLAESNDSSEAQTIANWKAASGITSPVIVTGKSQGNGVSNNGLILSDGNGEGIGCLGSGVPQNYILDKNGNLRLAWGGGNRETARKNIEATLAAIRAGYAAE